MQIQDNSDVKKNTGQPMKFQDPSMHCSENEEWIDEETDTDREVAIHSVFNVFQKTLLNWTLLFTHNLYFYWLSAILFLA